MAVEVEFNTDQEIVENANVTTGNADTNSEKPNDSNGTPVPSTTTGNGNDSNNESQETDTNENSNQDSDKDGNSESNPKTGENPNEDKDDEGQQGEEPGDETPKDQKENKSDESEDKESKDDKSDDSDVVDQSMNIDDYNEGDKFYGTIRSKPILNKKTNQKEIVVSKAIWTILKKFEDKDETHQVRNVKGDEYFVKKEDIKLEDLNEALNAKKALEEKRKKEEEEARAEAEREAKMFDFSKLPYHEQLRRTVDAGINNIWMVGPAGCGKSTMAMNLANSLSVPYYTISCGIGTSAAEFIGFKYPQRESTKFSKYYAEPSVILIDEMTALDPSVAQVLNAALANDAIETTTGLVKRHPQCIIIATSNTFGAGADRQYVANNQLDASTIDRFVGGIIEINYSEEYESRYDEECLEYVYLLREVIKQNDLRRVASTRTLQRCTQLKNCFFRDWRERMIVNWSNPEKALVQQALADLLAKKEAEYAAGKFKGKYKVKRVQAEIPNWNSTKAAA